MEQNRLWLLMARKLSGEATEQELQELGDLMRREPQAQYTYEVLAAVWHKGNESTAADPQTAEERGETVPAPWEEKSYRKGERFRRMRNIAIAACLAGIGITLFCFYPQRHSPPINKTEAGQNEVATRFGSRTKITLPDGTQVWLNAGSRLTYANDFSNAATREVELSGEAFFAVVHDASHPFVIHTRYMDIRDLGTRFDVKAYLKDNTTEATLIEGSISVALKSDPSHQIVLKPHEKITLYNEEEGTQQKDHAQEATLKEIKMPKNATLPEDIYKISEIVSTARDTLIPETAWMDNKLVFRSETFADLALQMERWYNVKISFKDAAIQHYRFTGMFADETIDQALNELRMIAYFRYHIVQNKVEISQ